MIEMHENLKERRWKIEMPSVDFTNKEGKNWNFHASKVVDTGDNSVRCEDTKWGTIFLPKTGTTVAGKVEDKSK